MRDHAATLGKAACCLTRVLWTYAEPSATNHLGTLITGFQHDVGGRDGLVP